ncbi:hypothetical protein [Pumilibacter muris]|uniref:hypothetical protein n=1 Tax=Pumilibacter muris TaxID=2941510 RepID=UPI00203E3095|nr:hypothetical protein [Pumilibacter muris]
MLDKKFDYGKLKIGHRLNINKPINHEERIIQYGIRMGFVEKAKGFTGESFWEVQIVYKDENYKLQCDCLKLDDYTIDILHKGNMQIEI